MVTVEVPMDNGTIATLRLPEEMTESDSARIASVVAAYVSDDDGWAEDE